MSLPKPQPALVIRYSYLGCAEQHEGREEGVKDRPCAVVLAVENYNFDKRPRVVVLPVTHTPPSEPAFAFGDQEASWARCWPLVDHPQ